MGFTKLEKALYGIRQSPRAWNLKLNNTLKNMGFQRCLQENGFYRKVSAGEFITVIVYVDDLLAIGTSLKFIDQYKKLMALQFEMLDLGELTWYLGIKVSQEYGCVKGKTRKLCHENCKRMRHAGVEYNSMSNRSMTKFVKG